MKDPVDVTIFYQYIINIQLIHFHYKSAHSKYYILPLQDVQKDNISKCYGAKLN